MMFLISFSPLFFFFFFSFLFFRMIILPSIGLLRKDMRVWFRCYWQPMLTSKPKIGLVGYYVFICAPSCVGVVG